MYDGILITVWLFYFSFPTINRPYPRHCEARSSLLGVIRSFELVKGCFASIKPLATPRNDVHFILEGLDLGGDVVILFPFPTINHPYSRHCEARSSLFGVIRSVELVNGCF